MRRSRINYGFDTEVIEVIDPQSMTSMTSTLLENLGCAAKYKDESTQDFEVQAKQE